MEEEKKITNKILFEATEDTLSYSVEGNFNTMVETVLDCLGDMEKEDADTVVSVLAISIEAYKEENK